MRGQKQLAVDFRCTTYQTQFIRRAITGMNRQFISYPKSGRTWLRYALTNMDMADDIGFHHDGFEFNDGSMPKLDFDLERRKKLYATAKVVYLARDPRDVMVSLYHQVTGRFKDYFDFDGDISDFIRHDYFGAHNLQAFRSMWDELCEHGVALQITYEECHNDFVAVLERILEHYQLSVSEEKLQLAKQKASFDRMKMIEQSGEFSEPWLRPRNGAAKVRNGNVGGYATALATKDIDYLNEIFGNLAGSTKR